MKPCGSMSPQATHSAAILDDAASSSGVTTLPFSSSGKYIVMISSCRERVQGLPVSEIGA